VTDQQRNDHRSISPVRDRAQTSRLSEAPCKLWPVSHPSAAANEPRVARLTCPEPHMPAEQSNDVVVNPSVGPISPSLAQTDPKKRRMEINRNSARRARQRKAAEVETLRQEVRPQTPSCAVHRIVLRVAKSIRARIRAVLFPVGMPCRETLRLMPILCTGRSYCMTHPQTCRFALDGTNFTSQNADIPPTRPMSRKVGASAALTSVYPAPAEHAPACRGGGRQRCAADGGRIGDEPAAGLL